MRSVPWCMLQGLVIIALSFPNALRYNSILIYRSDTLTVTPCRIYILH